MKQLFYITREKGDNSQLLLSLRLGEKHGCFAVTNKDGTELYELGYCSVNGWDEIELNALYFEYPVLQRSFYDYQVVYDFPGGAFVPSSVDNNGAAIFLDKGTQAGHHTITEQVAGWQLKTVYTVPRSIQKWLEQKFPSAKYRHQYSLGVRTIDTTGTDGALLADFREEDFTVLLARSGKILLAQCFPYSTPNDVLYYLLKLSQEFGLSQQDMQLSISGLVDQQSSLYRELYQYFIHIHFRTADWNAGSEYPGHFFTSLNDLAKCAS